MKSSEKRKVKRRIADLERQLELSQQKAIDELRGNSVNTELVWELAGANNEMKDEINELKELK